MFGTIFYGVGGVVLAIASPWLRVYGKSVEVLAMVAAFAFFVAFTTRVF